LALSLARENAILLKVPWLRGSRILATMKNKLQLLGCFALPIILSFQPWTIRADDGEWVITKLPFQYAEHPTINNSAEIVWAGAGGGIFSSSRGELSPSGVNPHLANSGEVVYADWFGGPYWDLVSTTRGRLTTNGLININVSDFGVNSNSEVVYSIEDTNGDMQVISTVRGQITFEAFDHWNPCINDNGEIAWNEYADDQTMAISSTRGTLGSCPNLLDLNNSGDYCFSGNVEEQEGDDTFPHIFSSAHGVIINDADQYQWGGSLNDLGTIVWLGPDGVYEANWVAIPKIYIIPEAAGFALEWPTNAVGFHVQFTTNLLSSSNWQAWVGNPSTNGAKFHLTIEQNPGNSAFFRLSNVSP
jgi:hypothetical protein